eukprot:TRINITY_DN36496_c0_g1_i1.p1 TRINITY_DN36496_c0_g1~~TRINITY_DN36496_c0_g1_i1.p1  ORF type:complete len:213 (-),score=47.68 TRINITY_DN36496_c0_g1_i1:360-998(-)
MAAQGEEEEKEEPEAARAGGRPTSVCIEDEAKNLLQQIHKELKSGAPSVISPHVVDVKRGLKCGTKTAEDILKRLKCLTDLGEVRSRACPSRPRQTQFFLQGSQLEGRSVVLGRGSSGSVVVDRSKPVVAAAAAAARALREVQSLHVARPAASASAGAKTGMEVQSTDSRSEAGDDGAAAASLGAARALLRELQDIEARPTAPKRMRAAAPS